MTQALQPTYDPPLVEAAWYDYWMKEGFFNSDFFANNGLKEPE